MTGLWSALSALETVSGGSDSGAHFMPFGKKRGKGKSLKRVDSEVWDHGGDAGREKRMRARRRSMARKAERKEIKRKEKEERRSQRRQQRRGTVQFDKDGDFGDEANAMEAAAAAMESVAEAPDGDDVD